MKKPLLLILPLFLYAEISLVQLQKSPKGHVRDFHLWQYMQGDINASCADTAYSLLDKNNTKIFKAYAKKTDVLSIKNQDECNKGEVSFLLTQTDADCINSGLSYKKAMSLSPNQKVYFSNLLKEKHPKKSNRIELMCKRPFLVSLLESGSDDFLKLFDTLGLDNRHRYFNVKLSKKHINKLADDKKFNRAIKLIVTDKKMHKMQRALLQLDEHDLSAQSYFFLALNALKFDDLKQVRYYLDAAYDKAYYAMDKDRALFWKFLVFDDFKDLKRLSESCDINIYTLYAKEKLHIETTNYFTSLSLRDSPSVCNLSDPYVWEDLVSKIRKASKEELTQMLNSFNTKEDEVLHAFIYSKSIDYKTHNYILPYKESIQTLSNDDKALIYALARQESHFIPSAISRSYALGVMQIMPFLIKDLSKRKQEDIELNAMFDPQKNIEYATTHLKYLQQHLYHPLFIAYAYNGGIGFTKRHLLKGTFLKKKHEPFLSMELMANTESREYGKKVLANYVIYKKILGEEVSLISLFETLVEPSRTDRFRMKVLSQKHLSH